MTREINCSTRCPLFGTPRATSRGLLEDWEAGSNTSTVTLRVVGGDEKGSLKSETVKYSLKSQGTRTQERLRWQGQQHIQKTDPTSRQRGRPTRTRP
jgi:hypothetical protein